MKVGDIFLGTIVDIQNSRYHIERFGSITIIPTWEVKKIEKNQSTLLMSTEAIPLQSATQTFTESEFNSSIVKIVYSQPANEIATTTASAQAIMDDSPQPRNVRQFELMGKILPVISAPPAEPSHLEMYPRLRWWDSDHRYLRGYLVNQTLRGYKSLRLEITYYTEIPGDSREKTNPHTNISQFTEIFDVYPMTMKPFIVDTYFVPWKKVKRINFQIIGKSPL